MTNSRKALRPLLFLGFFIASIASAQGVLHPLELPQNDSESFYAVIEVPLGEAVKYEINDDTGRIDVDRFVSMAMSYPANYGGVPRTKGGDGDPLDVLVLSRMPISPGAAVRVRPIGALRMLDEGEEDDKIVAVPVDGVDATWQEIREIKDLPEMERERLEAFFRVYKILPRRGKLVDLLGWANADAAQEKLTEAFHRWRDDNDYLRSHLNQAIPRAMAEAAVPGLSIAVFRGDETVFVRGFGVRNLDDGAPVALRTVFEAASLSKPVVAYRALQLVDDGLLDLDEPLANYLDEPWEAVDGIERVTARMVLRHSTGLPNWRPKRFTDEPGELTFRNEPDSEWGYSGEGFMYLQAALEAITARPLADDLQERIFEPLGMESSSFVWRPEYDETTATGHRASGTPRTKRQPAEASAAASLHTTASDWTHFFRAVLQGSEKAPLSAESRELMLKPSFDVDEQISWSLGWGLENGLLWHWGDNWVFKALTFGDPETGLGVVVLTNGETGLRAARPIVEAIFPGAHPALDSGLLSY